MENVSITMHIHYFEIAIKEICFRITIKFSGGNDYFHLLISLKKLLLYRNNGKNNFYELLNVTKLLSQPET